MRIVILNWDGGENDPFSYFSASLRRQLAGLGHEALIVPYDGRMAEALYALHRESPVHLAFTWMGLGSDLRPHGFEQNLWELLGIPLVCIHGDHPSYAPMNHQRSSRHVLQLYPCPSFARAADRLYEGAWPATVAPLPNFFEPPEDHPQFEGEFFVFPKNLQHLDELRAGWRERFSDGLLGLLLTGAEAIRAAFLAGRQVDHHEVLLDTLPSAIASAVRTQTADAQVRQLVTGLGQELDRVYRNVAAVFVLDTLHDVPIQVYGRGWERHAALGNPRHSFHAFDRLTAGSAQFHSAYGIFDIAPVFDVLHDRIFRAMRQGAGVLSCCSWRRGEPIHEGFRDLFFWGDADTLAARVETVRRDPAAHRGRVAAFSQVYDGVFPFAAYLALIMQHIQQRGFVQP